jgi:hypothetical protein
MYELGQFTQVEARESEQDIKICTNTLPGTTYSFDQSFFFSTSLFRSS